MSSQTKSTDQPSSSPTAPYPVLPKTLILTSTKSYFSPERTLAYLKALLDPSNNISALPSEILFGLIPDHLTIYPCTTILSDPRRLRLPLRLALGFTSPTALASLGVRIVELGHAERRRIAHETDESTAAKAAAACELDAPNLSGPMSQSVGVAMRQLTPQITSLLDAVPDDAPVIFAYEPVWAIGAAKPAGVGYVGPVVQAIRSVVKSQETRGRTGLTRVVYGGSAGPGLWSGEATEDGVGLGEFVDGMFLGRFAHEIEGVRKVVKEVRDSVTSRR
ncbi:putative triosephosphate isomerase [Cyphellophora attinorum]|uniref:Triosephosphate isomerase n=1 Tax=Cyphellophora attinorum TaxID=1664694 RepID=A0A0N0NQT3_9EURO|nr:putative triosephosphate isomerase [Phialophora attinorum]KPI44049.1 putative triosephosphate isomerase [Phialophora attinorum]